MIHGVRIKDGKSTYVSRYVKTSRLKQEEFFGAAKFMKVMDLVCIHITSYLWELSYHINHLSSYRLGTLRGFWDCLWSISNSLEPN